MREHFITTLVALAREDERIWMLTPDLGYSVLEPFMEAFPERYINTGIAEQNAVGIAAGLALSGKIPYVYSIAPFVFARPYEQIRLDCAYMNTSVRLIGVGGGLSYGALGATHHATEDLAVMSALPNMAVLAPGCINEAVAAANISVKHEGPMYIRLAKRGEPDYGYTIEFGKIKLVAEGGEFALLATSTMLEEAHALHAAFEGRAALYSAHTLKPFDEAAIHRLIESKTPIVTLEEHNIIGGLASRVASVIATSGLSARFLPIAIPDVFSHYVGSQKFIRERVGLGGCRQKIEAFLASG